MLLLTAYPLEIEQKEQKGQYDHDALGDVVVHQIELFGIVLDHPGQQCDTEDIDDLQCYGTQKAIDELLAPGGRIGQHACEIDEHCLQTVAAKFDDHIGVGKLEGIVMGGDRDMHQRDEPSRNGGYQIVVEALYVQKLPHRLVIDKEKGDGEIERIEEYELFHIKVAAEAAEL